MDSKEIVLRFKYHAPTEDQIALYEKLRAQGLYLADIINDFCPESREKSLAITKLEETIMWANAAIARREKTHA